MAKQSISNIQKYAILLVVLAAIALLAAPLFPSPIAPSEKAGEAEAFFSNVANSPSVAIIADITDAKTQEAKTAILQCSVDLRSNIISARGKNTVYIACDGSSCLVSRSNEANSTEQLSPSQISNATFGMPQFYISYGKPIEPAYFPDRAHFWINGTLSYPCSIYSIEIENNSTAAGNSSQ